MSSVRPLRSWHRTLRVIRAVCLFHSYIVTTASNPAVVISTPPLAGGWRSYQTVLPNVVAPQARFSGPAPPSGWPSRLGLKRALCVVASVVSVLSVNPVSDDATAGAVGRDGRELSWRGGSAKAGAAMASAPAAVAVMSRERKGIAGDSNTLGGPRQGQ